MPLDLKDKKQVCFVCPYAYPLFNQACQSPFGGSEVRIATLAKGLAGLGNFEISMLVFDHDQPRVEVSQGVHLIAWRGKNSLLPVFIPGAALPEKKSSLQDWLSLPAKAYGALVSHLYSLMSWVITKTRGVSVYRQDFSILEEVAADIFLIAGNSELTADLVAYGKAKGKTVILLAGSEGDFDPAIETRPETTNAYGVPHHLMRYNIENADVIVVQTERQHKLLKDVFYREGWLIRNPVALDRSFPKTSGIKEILWIGKSDRVKRPGLALDLASLFPDVRFHLVMALSDPNIFSEIRRRAAELPNVRLSFFIPYDEIELSFAEASLFLSTSAFEGFPNTFLQAAKYGVPIVSLGVDPDGMLSTHGCGRYCAGDFDRLAQDIFNLMRDETECSRIGSRGIAYVQRFHDANHIVRALEDLLRRYLPAETR